MTNTQEIITHYWDLRAHAYHSYHIDSERAHADRRAWKNIFRRFIPSTAQRVLDVGTGDGYVAHLLADLGLNVVGIDTSSGMLAEARAEESARRQRNLPSASFRQGDATALPTDLSNFDVVTSRFLMWTLRTPVHSVESWTRVLRPGGRIITADANWFTQGIPQTTKVQSAEGPDAFIRAYSGSVISDLPLATADSPERYADIFREVGLKDVAVTWLPEITALDEKYGTAPGHESKPHFIVCGSTPV